VGKINTVIQYRAIVIWCILRYKIDIIQWCCGCWLEVHSTPRVLKLRTQVEIINSCWILGYKFVHTLDCTIVVIVENTLQMLFLCIYEGRSISSRTNSPNSITVNHTILTLVLLFNIVSLQFNTAFPSFYKFVETCSIEVFVGCT